MRKLIMIDAATAEGAGYRALTIGYQLPREKPMLDNVLADLRRGRIKHCLVETHGSVAVWRASGACTQSGDATAKPPLTRNQGLRAGRGTVRQLRSAATKGRS